MLNRSASTILTALGCLIATSSLAAPGHAAPPAPPPAVSPVPPAPAEIRGLSCTADDRSVREIVIDFTAGRWREGGQGWNKIAAQDDATITLVQQGGGMFSGLLSDMRRLERLDRSTLILSTELHTGLIDEVRAYRCKIVAPFDAKRQI
ncbi:hypothetical protein [Sphingobium sp.]|uniref:hypothetical protein n=1 Tax=Sphingobium TaxID=165695 RepID=UPI001A1AD55B|nr:hypothetical protein [Sphingobium sp.]MBJ7377460.1 hypothetical protein [Sphingobium sp.]